MNNWDYVAALAVGFVLGVMVFGLYVAFFHEAAMPWLWGFLWGVTATFLTYSALERSRR